jgi:hypothetical protein
MLAVLGQKNCHQPANELIKGKWDNVDWGHCDYDDYNYLEFTDSALNFTYRIGGYSFGKYLVYRNMLAVIDSTGDRADTTYSQILKITEDTLILSSIRNKKFKHTYSRVKPIISN